MGCKVHHQIHDLPWTFLKPVRYYDILHQLVSSDMFSSTCAAVAHEHLFRFYYGIRTADSPLVPRAQTNWFLEGSLTQVCQEPPPHSSCSDHPPKLFIIQFLRTGKVPFFQSRASTSVVLITFGMACLSMAIPYIPKLNSALQMVPPEREYYGYLVAMVAGYAVVIQVVKVLYQLMFKEWL